MADDPLPISNMGKGKKPEVELSRLDEARNLILEVTYVR